MKSPQAKFGKTEQADDLDRSFDSEMTELYDVREAEDDQSAVAYSEDDPSKAEEKLVVKDDINLSSAKAVVNTGDDVDEGFVTPQWSPEKDGDGNGKDGETGEALKNLIDSIGDSDLLHMQLEPVSEETLNQALATAGIDKQPAQRKVPAQPRLGLGRGKPYHTPPRPKAAGRGSGGRGSRGRGGRGRGGAAVGRGRGAPSMAQVPVPASSAPQSNLLDMFKGHGSLLAGLGASSPPVAKTDTSPQPRSVVPKQKPAKAAQVKKPVSKKVAPQTQEKPAASPQQQSPSQAGMSPALASMLAGHAGLLKGIAGPSQDTSAPLTQMGKKVPTKGTRAKNSTPAKPARGKKATVAQSGKTHAQIEVQPQVPGKKSPVGNESTSPPLASTEGSSALAQMFSGSSSLLQGLGIQQSQSRPTTPLKTDPLEKAQPGKTDSEVQPVTPGKKSPASKPSTSPSPATAAGSSALAQMFSGSSSLLQGLGVQQSQSLPTTPPKADPKKGKAAKKPRASRKPKLGTKLSGDQPQEMSGAGKGAQIETGSGESSPMKGVEMSGDAKPKGRGRPPKVATKVSPGVKPKVQGRSGKSKVQDVHVSSSSGEQDKVETTSGKPDSPSPSKAITERGSRPITPATRPTTPASRPITPAESVHSTGSVRARPGTPMARVDTPTPTTPERPQRRPVSRASTKSGSRPASRTACSRAGSRPVSRAAASQYGSRPGSVAASQCGSDDERGSQKSLTVAIEVFKCGSCEQTLPSRDSLEEHMNDVHRIPPRLDTPPATESDSGDEGEEEPLAGSMQAQQQGENSVEVPTGHVPEEEHASNEATGEVPHVEEGEGNFWCSTCRRSWKKYDDYDQHLREVHDKTD